MARLDRRRAAAHGGLLRGLAFGRADAERPGGASLRRQQPPPAAPWQLLQLLRRPVHREQLHRPGQEIDPPEEAAIDPPEEAAIGPPEEAAMFASL